MPSPNLFNPFILGEISRHSSPSRKHILDARASGCAHANFYFRIVFLIVCRDVRVYGYFHSGYLQRV